MINSIIINDDCVQHSVSERNVGVVVDQSAFFHIRRIEKIGEYLSIESTATLMHAFVSCRLDG